MRRDAGETGQLFVSDPTDLRHQGKDRGCRAPSDARYRAQDLSLSRQLGIGRRHRRDLGIDLADLPLDLRALCPALIFEQGMILRLEPIAQPRPIRHQCAPRKLQLLERMHLFRGRPIRFEIQSLSHAREQPCIDHVRFRPTAAGFGKAPGLKRIDLHERQHAGERALEGTMEGAGWLKDHPGHPSLAEPGPQVPQAARRIGKPCAPVRLEIEHVTLRFRNVHADATIRHLSQSCACHACPLHAYPFRPKVEDGGRSHLRTVRQDQPQNDPAAAAARYI
jgi:hypothetical protein